MQGELVGGEGDYHPWSDEMSYEMYYYVTYRMLGWTGMKADVYVSEGCKRSASQYFIMPNRE